MKRGEFEQRRTKMKISILNVNWFHSLDGEPKETFSLPGCGRQEVQLWNKGKPYFSSRKSWPSCAFNEYSAL